MREIKFRAKRMDSNEWLFGSLFIDKNKHCYIKEPNGKLYLIKNKDTVEQFSDLKDKNGKDIYEGDVIRCTLLDDKERIGVVQFYKGCFWFICNNGYSDEYLYYMCDKEIIGNVVDNPELIKK